MKSFIKDLLDELVDLISDGVDDTGSILVFERDSKCERQGERETS